MKIVGTALAIFWVRTLVCLIVVATVFGLLFRADFYLKKNTRSKAIWLLKDAGMKASVDEAVSAAGEGRLFSVAVLDRSGVDLGQMGVGGETPLVAAIRGDSEMVADYLIKEFEVERTLFLPSRRPEAGTAFEEAVQSGRLDLAKKIERIVKELNQGEHPDLKSMVRKKYETLPALNQIDPSRAIEKWGDNFPLLLAVERGELTRIRKLVDFGADADIEGPDGNSLLAGSILKGKYEIAAELLEVRASVNPAESSLGKTPLEAAIKSGELRMIELVLARGANPNLPESAGNSPLAYAIEKQKVGLAALLIRNGADVSPAGLAFSALGNNDHACLTLLLKSGASPDLKNSEGLRLLDKALILNLPECTEVILRSGADMKNSLALALHSDNPALVDALLTHGADIDQLGGEEGGALLDYAFKTNNMELVAILIKHGANLDVISRAGGLLLDRELNGSRSDSIR